jgi:hypothetical protein
LTALRLSNPLHPFAAANKGKLARRLLEKIVTTGLNPLFHGLLGENRVHFSRDARDAQHAASFVAGASSESSKNSVLKCFYAHREGNRFLLLRKRATPPILIFAMRIFYMLALSPRGGVRAMRLNTVGDYIEMHRAALLSGYQLFARRRSVVVDVS